MYRKWSGQVKSEYIDLCILTKYILLVVWCQFPIRPEASLIAVSRSLRTSLSCSSGDLQRSSRRGFTMLEISYTFWQYFWIGLGLAVEPSDVKTPRREMLLSRVLGERLSINPVQACASKTWWTHNYWKFKNIHIWTHNKYISQVHNSFFAHSLLTDRIKVWNMHVKCEQTIKRVWIIQREFSFRFYRFSILVHSS
jgi:hypothetical protein